ncbi:YqiA/YcfP family alpha/beta fold hydrolase [Geminocystis herdmanii]|uniref:YqiA/YcfP family alpha/beta fold hydrolase n=1 Tax=Geminocystis herdmanii TaxID=669359 RepID=UPI00034C49AC|nr:YqiA/YcfP family alpha/beta fold hydrolase [Geminocystis herdmanii]
MNQPTQNYQYLYLHGFTSSPKSYKAVYFNQKYQEIGITLNILDFNQPDFVNLSLTRQINQVSQIIEDNPHQQFILIGSSFGGLTANWIGYKYTDRIKALVLIAPALNFAKSWLPKLTEETLKQWQEKGFISVYHHGENKELLLSYHFWKDLITYDDSIVNHDIPTLIFHGTEDATIPIEVSREYAQNRPQVILKEFNSDHTLGDCVDQMWLEIVDFTKALK